MRGTEANRHKAFMHAVLLLSVKARVGCGYLPGIALSLRRYVTDPVRRSPGAAPLGIASKGISLKKNDMLPPGVSGRVRNLSEPDNAKVCM